MNDIQAKPSNTPHYDPRWVAGFFDEYGMREWERLAQSPVDEVSFYVHARRLQQFVTPGMRVLEIGAGPGRFTQVLAELGARVVVSDISPVQLDLNRQQAREHGFAHAVEDWQPLDMCDMPMFGPAAFDAVVAYGGPFSYVFDRRDAALRECRRVLKPGGPLLLSVMTIWGSAHRRLDGVLAIPPEQNRHILNTGDILPGSFDGAKHFSHLFRARELREWLAGAGLDVVAMSAAGVLSLRWDETLAAIRADEAKWRELLDMEWEASAEPGAWDMGTHLIAVASGVKGG